MIHHLAFFLVASSIGAAVSAAASCSVQSSPPEPSWTDPIVSVPAHAVVPDQGVTTSPDPCRRFDVVRIEWDGGWRDVPVALPCQPYDRLRDLPYPQP